MPANVKVNAGSTAVLNVHWIGLANPSSSTEVLGPSPDVYSSYCTGSVSSVFASCSLSGEGSYGSPSQSNAEAASNAGSYTYTIGGFYAATLGWGGTYEMSTGWYLPDPITITLSGSTSAQTTSDTRSTDVEGYLTAYVDTNLSNSSLSITG